MSNILKVYANGTILAQVKFSWEWLLNLAGTLFSCVKIFSNSKLTSPAYDITSICLCLKRNIRLHFHFMIEKSYQIIQYFHTVSRKNIENVELLHCKWKIWYKLLSFELLLCGPVVFRLWTLSYIQKEFRNVLESSSRIFFGWTIFTYLLNQYWLWHWTWWW